ncbi:hypothetical protein JCM30760_20120 [Thiomicrorhabdus hydrogeniphila]
MTIGNTQQRILETSAERFASKGYDALTMRDIATACNIKAPSLYNHFKDKQELYQATLKYVFTHQGQDLIACLQTNHPAEQKLDHFIALACEQMAANQTFRKLFIRELLEQDEQHLQFLAKEVMADACYALHDVFIELKPNCDPHFLTTSLLALVFFHFQANSVRLYLPGGNEHTLSLEYLTQNIQKMIRQQLHV